MTSVAQVTIYDTSGNATGDTIALSSVFNTPVRPDLIQFVHTNMRKNARQSYGVQVHNGPCGIVAGHQHSASSWGTGRAVSRIPRVSGGGTHRAGQGAFGNMCRSGRMFAPTKIWRKWHRKINLKQKRYATASAIAASACAPLVQARGHRIENLKEIPLVVDFTTVKKTSEALKLLKDLGLAEELAKCKNKTTRAGKGKYRRGKKQRKGPLVIYLGDKDNVLGFRNLPGVDTCEVSRLNLLQLAPGGHLGRLCIWTKDAMNKLKQVYDQKAKSGFPIPSNVIQNADITGNLRKRSLPAAISEVFDNVVVQQSVQKELHDQKSLYQGKRKKIMLTREKNAKKLYVDG